VTLRSRLLDVRPLRTDPRFRRFWLGSTVSTFGGQLSAVALLYQAWTLTHSPVVVGAVGVAQAVPMVVLGVVGGALADAVDRRRLVLLTTAGQLVAALLLTAQGAAGPATIWPVFAVVALQASCGALGAPARRTFAPRLLPKDQVAAGIALTHLGFQAAMLVGPAVAGVVVAQWGVAACYLLDAASFAVGLYGVRGLPPMRPDGARVRADAGSVRDGWRFIGRRPVLRGAFLTDALATVLAMPIALFPMVVAQRFGGAPQTLGLLFSAIAVGGVVAGALSGAVTRSRRPGSTMLAAATVWGLGIAGFGLAGQLWLVLLCLAVAGAADTVSVISRGTVVQLATPDSHRGRVSAVEHVIGVAGPDLGTFRGGLVAGLTSAAFAAVSGGLLCVLGVALVAARNPALRRFDAAAHTDPETLSAARP
jgi:MFS family permease